MHCLPHRPVLIELIRAVEHRTAFFHHAFRVRGEAAAQDQADFARSPGRVERCKSFIGAIQRLKSRMHRPHDHAVGQHRRADGQRGKDLVERLHGVSLCVLRGLNTY
ncbi:hypothetical protein D3C72_2137590 [compost metagenome]